MTGTTVGLAPRLRSEQLIVAGIGLGAVWIATWLLTLALPRAVFLPYSPLGGAGRRWGGYGR